ncbi:hypothetical protein ALC57_11336, partial [Trachymyrmex cornetzi]
RNQYFVFSDSSRYSADVMETPEISDKWMSKHVRKLDNFTVRCNIDSCHKIFIITSEKTKSINKIKSHLYKKHGKLNEEDRLKWINDKDLIWQYFNKVDFYQGKCNFCKNQYKAHNIPTLKYHLKKNHNQEIRAIVKEEIAKKSLSQYFEIYEEEFIAFCKRCHVRNDIFYGIDALINHICLDNKVNKMAQQSIADENTNLSSHYDFLNRQAFGNRKNEQSDTSRYSADVMATPEISDKWVSKHVRKLENFTVQCNIDNCDETYVITNNKTRTINKIKAHLYKKHGKYNEEDYLKWVNDNDLIWRYFDKEDYYEGKCKFCKIQYKAYYIPALKYHLQKNHNREIRTAVKEEITNKSLSQYFEIHAEELSAWCKWCKVKNDIFYGIDALINHICLDNNVNKMIQQSLAEENTNLSSHHDNLNRQALGLRKNEQRTTPRHSANVMAAQKTSDNWVWNHVLESNNFTVQCNIDKCNKIYYNRTKNITVLTKSIKKHLYRKHNISTAKDCLKWARNNDLIWRYYDKAELYKGKCKFCKKFHCAAHVSSLKSHLQTEHSPEIRAAVQKEIAAKSLSQYFKIDDKEFSARCKRCNDKINIFYGADDLIHHICLDNNVKRMTQSMAIENANRSSHHDDINKQALRNPDQQSSEGNNTNNTIFLADDISDVSSRHDGTSRQTLGYQIDQQSYEGNNTNNIVFRAHDVSDVSSGHDSTNWQALGYQIVILTNEYILSYEGNNTNNIVFRAHDVSDISSGHDSTNWQALGYQIVILTNEYILSYEGNNTNNIVFRAHDVSDISSGHDSTNWQALGYQIGHQTYEGNNTNNIVFRAHDVSDISSGHDSTNWQALGYQIVILTNEYILSYEGNNTNNIVFRAHDVSDISSPYDGPNRQTLGYQIDQQGNTSRHCADVMAAQKSSDNWVWNHVLEVDNVGVQCNIDSCDQTYIDNTSISKSQFITQIKEHLCHQHGIWTEEDRKKWKNDNSLVWKYFNKVDLYKGKCKFCDSVKNGAYLPNLMSHLRKKHSQEIRAAVQKEITTKSLWLYFEICEEQFNAQCKRCNCSMDIFYGTDALIHHICAKKIQRLEFRQKSKDNKVNRMTQQSIADKNTSTSSHDDSINRQVLGNPESERSNTSRHCADVMAAQKPSDNWVWNHVLELNNLTLQCKIYSCIQTYAVKRNKLKMTFRIKAHLYHKHGIWSVEDRLKWENNNDLIWRYYDKVGLYKERCNFCKNVYHEAYIPCLNLHLQRWHSQEVRDVVRKEITTKSLWLYFEICEEQFNARCKRCNFKMDIFYGIDVLINHICLKKNLHLKFLPKSKDNEVNRMTQQSIATEIANTISHHDDINWPAPRNQDQQSFNNHTISVFYSSTGINDLRSHCLYQINEDSTYEEGAADNSEYRMMQQDVPVENMATSYHHESTYWYGLGNQDGQQRNTPRYWTWTDVMAAWKTSDNWIWKHVLELDNFTLQCNMDKCNKTYCYKYKNITTLEKSIKEHLYRKHKIWTEEDLLNWKKNNDLIWQYYDKVDLYKGKCKFCKKFYHATQLSNQKTHLQRKHRPEIIAAIRKEIATKSLSQHFKIDDKEFSARCKRCNDKINIFYGADALIHHICLKRNQHFKSRPESKDNEVNRMTQFIATEIANTSSHHDDINWPAPRNQDQQSSTEINNLRSHCQYHINEDSRYEKGAADNSESRMMHGDVPAQHIATNYHHESTYWYVLGNQDIILTNEHTSSSEENNTNNTIFLADDVSDASSRHNGTNWQAFGYQMDQQRMMHQSVAAENMATSYHDGSTYSYVLGNQDGQQSSEENNMNNTIFLADDVSDVSSHHDGTSWQTFGYQMDQQRMMHQSVAAKDMATSYHDGSTYSYVLGNQDGRQSSEGINMDDMVQFYDYDVSGLSSRHDSTNWQAFGYQVDEQRMMHQFVAAENIATTHHLGNTYWQAPVSQEGQQK